MNPTCAHCKKEVPAVYRSVPKGEVGPWLCIHCLPTAKNAPVPDAETRELAQIISGVADA